MDQYVKKYINQTKKLFPILGKPEKAYLTSLSADVENYFADKSPQSIDEIYQVFGMPQRAVKEYLAGTDTSAVVSRIYKRKVIRTISWAIMAMIFCAALAVIIKCGLTLYGDQIIEGYVAPVYSAEGDRLE